MELVPVKVVIGTKPEGGALYPNFNTLASVSASGLDWSLYIDRHGAGWQYDSVGHKEDVVGSPIGTQLGMILVPAAFATEAVAAFPAVVSTMTSAEATTFYDTQHAKYFDEEILIESTLSAIKAKQEIVPPIDLTTNQTNALNPLNATPGISPNVDKTFAGFKTKRGITIAP